MGGKYLGTCLKKGDMSRRSDRQNSCTCTFSAKS